MPRLSQRPPSARSHLSFLCCDAPRSTHLLGLTSKARSSHPRAACTITGRSVYGPSDVSCRGERGLKLHAVKKCGLAKADAPQPPIPKSF
eukprot:6196712-Pleurochrysis_carterae.AAC.2